MDLWIRSQDRKSLTKVSNVQYTYKEGSLYTDVNGKHYIGTYYDNLKILGTYATKERALEVLDEIQKLLMPIMKCTPIVEEDIKPEYTYKHYVSKGSDIEVIQLNNYVYEMPLE